MNYGFSRRVLVLAAIALGVSGRVRAAGEGPRAPVERLHETLTGVLREAAALGFAGRYERLAATLPDIYDFATMTRLAVGGAWAEATDDQRARLTAAFQAMSAATYARRFDAWAEQRFEITGERMFDDGGVVIQTLLHPGAGAAPVALDYRLHRLDAGWRVIDVYLTGTVSELATRRSEFSSVLRDQGLDGLIAALEAKAAE